jgi:cytidylate kinase
MHEGPAARFGPHCVRVPRTTNRLSVPARTHPIVAIDGPAGAGKSTVSRNVADALGFVLVDTGAMYRAVALESEKAGIAWTDGPGVAQVARDLVMHHALRLLPDVARGVRVEVRGLDVSDAIRSPEIGLGASAVSVHGEVRAALLDLQRQAGHDGGVVLEGRDIGTVVFPDAEAKFFLTARPEVRAQRRYEELVAKGQSVTLEQTLREVIARDTQDEMRPVAPLRRADDAVEIDCSSRSVSETVCFIVDRVKALSR